MKPRQMSEGSPRERRGVNSRMKKRDKKTQKITKKTKIFVYVKKSRIFARYFGYVCAQEHTGYA